MHCILITAMLLIALPAFSQSDAGADVVEVRLITDNGHGIYYFQPAGLYIEPGQTVRFLSIHYFHSVTAYHPENGDQELRIPENAEPFDVLLGDGAQDAREAVEITFDEPGTYDFYCRLHESRGQVGRIVVGKPGGPASTPPGYGTAPAQPDGFVGLSVSSTRISSVQRILKHLDPKRIRDEKKVNLPMEELTRFGNAYHAVHTPIPD